jgi:hypothetical protein
VPTSPSGKFEVLFRFYGPERPLFDRTWVLPDIERITAQWAGRRAMKTLCVEICAGLLLAATTNAVPAQAQSAPPAPAGDGAIIHRLSVKAVPVDGFWSITVYNSEGYIQKNEYDAYSVNDITANKSADGSVAVQFGGCNGTIANCLPIMAGWNYWVRLYRPRAEILNGTWKFPEAQSTR